MTYKIRYTNPNPTLISTLLEVDISLGASEIKVTNTEEFSANDFILIEGVGCELIEMRKITSVDDSTTLTLDLPLQYNHLFYFD